MSSCSMKQEYKHVKAYGKSKKVLSPSDLEIGAVA